MSELNKEVPKKKNKTLLIFLSIFTILAIGITAVLIYLTNNTKADGEVVNENTIKDVTVKSKDESYLAVSLTDTYNTNAVEYKTYWYLDGEIRTNEEIEKDENFQDEDYEKIATFIQISGLKNENVQNKINQEIKSKAIESLKENERVYIYVCGNFADVLSISMNICKGDNYTQTGLNYELVTGEEIKFKDLFTNEAYIKTILTQAAYEQLVWKYTNDDNPSENAENMDYSKIEVETFELVQSYLSNPDIDFDFSPNYIYANINNSMVEIYMPDFYEHIAIYKRYLSNNSLYKDESKACKNLYVFSSRITDEYNLYYNKFEQLTDNLFVDIWLYDADNKGQKDKEINQMQEILNNVKKEAEENQDKAYIFTYFTYGDESNITIMKYEMDRSYYDEHGQDIIARSNRQASLADGAADIEVYYTQDDKNIIQYIYDKGKFITMEEYNIQNGWIE